MNQDPVTLTRFIIQNQRKYPHAKGDLTVVLNAVQLASKIISNAASKAGIYNLYGLDGSDNSSGDAVKKLDVYSNETFINAMRYTDKISIMASEENEQPIVCDTKEGKYAIVFDPLDGSSNIDANVSVGTIFGIYRCGEAGNPCMNDLLQKGTNLVCSGYTMYGGATILVLTFGPGMGVNGFTLDPQLGEFVLTHEDIRIPDKGKIYSVNEGNSSKWEKPLVEYVTKCKRGPKPKKARYIGSMVADVHRTLLYGGIFMYPADKKNANGKLRLVYELNPMAFLVEAAGGLASTGSERILELQPTKIHERRPVVLGSRQDVLEVQKMYRVHGGSKL